jgi:hypothetical protein
MFDLSYSIHVFDRYNIVNDQDLKEAAKKKQAYHETL